MAIAAAPHLENQNGSIITTKKALAVPAKSLVVAIEPVQFGSGDPGPDNVRPISGWTGANVTRTGKNLLPFGDLDGIKAQNTSGTWNGNNYEKNGVVFTVLTDSDGNVTGIKMNGTATAATSIAVRGVSAFTLPAGIYAFTGVSVPNGRYDLNLRKTGQSTDIVQRGTPVNLNLDVDTEFNSCYIWVNAGATVTNQYVYPMIRLATVSDAAFAPYTGTTYPISWQSEAGTVYGGMLDVTTGLLKIEYLYNELTNDYRIDLYTWASKHGVAVYDFLVQSGYRLPGYCSHDVIYDDKKHEYNFWLGMNNKLLYWLGILDTLGISTVDEFKAWLDTQHVQFAYKIPNPVTYQLTPTEVTLLLGDNNVWADTGDVTMKYWSH